MDNSLISPTAYDDVFRTLVNDCSKLVIPLINEAFGESYTGNEEIQFSPNEHFLNQQDGSESRRITDTTFAIIGKEKKRYHLECESTVDYSLLIRIFEYDAQIALDQDSEVVNNKIIVSFPHTAVLFLRSIETTPDMMQIVIRTPGGAVSYDVPVMKVKSYTIEEIFEKDLLFLIPFYIFTYESSFEQINCNDDQMAELKAEYERIHLRLEDMAKKGTISEFYKKTIMDMSERVLANIAAKYSRIKEGVGSVMCGQVLDYEAKRILNAGLAKGREEGLEKGREEGLEKGREEGMKKGREEGLEKGREEGLEKGREEGMSIGKVYGMIDTLRDMGLSDKEITGRIMAKYQLNEEDAKSYVLEPVMA